MSRLYRVAFVGFTEFERGALGSYFRLATNREPRYEQVHMLTDADFLVADADHAPSVQLVVATDRLAETVFIGSQAPAGAVAWMSRPIDALHAMRELDAMAALQDARREEAAAAYRPTLEPPPGAGATREVAESIDELRLRDDLSPAPPDEALAQGLGASAPLAPSRTASPASATAASPAGSAHDTAEPPTAPVTPTGPPVSAAHQPRALIVDDSEIAQRFLQTRLLPWNLIVDRAGSSARARDLMRRHSYDLIFLDVELGPDSEIDGLALCQQIKQSTAAVNATVVIVSAHHTELDRVRGALAGCDAYLGKPLDAAELERLLLRLGFSAPGAGDRKRKRRAAGATPGGGAPRG
jgi:CheY-like chemotaxis protein